ncbi:MAG: murein biosynthesis integral membrane protein MurJ [Thermoanaerobaculia bacterium]|nr:murein biosynthesis integral membrane protein MurJ [Thermoanaerobaculia bacterium]
MRSHAIKAAAGIFLSRIFGFLRSALQARYFGVGAHADVLATSFRLPNVLQNLLGEQSLSAAFIPIYSRMLEEGRREEAGRFAGAIFGLLLTVAAGLSLLGVLLARPLVAVFAAGFLREADPAGVDRYELAVQGVQIIFPMVGILVLSAWCLGVLNSHRRFLLSYLAPVAWNAVIIAVLVWLGESFLRPEGPTGEGITLLEKSRLYFAVCWGALVGGALQFLVQLPTVLGVLRGFRLSLSTRVTGVREALAAFGPVVAARGVVQVTGYLDHFLATFFAAGAVAAFDYTLRLYSLPIALFALSVAAVELPELSRLGEGDGHEGDGGGGEEVRRVVGGLRQVAFLTAPTVIGYLVFGHLIVEVIFRRGEFGAQSHWLVYLTLALFTLGLLPTTLSRLLTNAFYARGDTKTPAKIAVLRMVVAVVLAAPLMWWLDRFTLEPWLPREGVGALHLGVLGLGVGSAVAAWLEISLLRGRLADRMAGFRVPVREIGRMLGLSVVAAVPAGALWWRVSSLGIWPSALLVLGLYAGAYLGGAWGLDFPEVRIWIQREGSE